MHAGERLEYLDKLAFKVQEVIQKALNIAQRPNNQYIELHYTEISTGFGFDEGLRWRI